MDTGAWVALTVEPDRLHARAEAALRALLQSRTLLILSDYIVSETATLLRYRAGHRPAIRFLDILDRSIEKGDAALVRVSADDFREAHRTFEACADQDFSFVDCTSFALARRNGIDTVFGYDHHFSVMGFQLVG